ncbi:MAG: ABC transporter permease [Chitinophagales bacterium]|nr:ABC transporter permease [Chitinophagales bacterium]
MDFYLSAVLLGLAFCSMGFGIYISLRIFNIPDITTDGSYTLGAAVTASLLTQGIALPLVVLIVMGAGALAGACTGIIHTRFKIQPLLAGILVMTSLYSVNLNIMGRSNLPLIGVENAAGMFRFLPSIQTQWLLLLLVIIIFLVAFLSWFLKTDFGVSMRATGNSELMVRALGVNTQNMKVIGLAMANALTSVSGFLVCQFQQFSDINMGIGIVIFGLGSVMMGEAFISILKAPSILKRLLGVVLGCVVFRLIVAVALDLGINPNWLKAVTAVIVLLVVGIPNLKKSSI